MEARRSDFSIPDGVHYLNCAYMSPIPRTVEEAGVAGVRRKRNPAAIDAADFFTESDRARAMFARLIAADPEGVAIVPGVSYGLEAVARNLTPPAGSTFLVLAEQFPSNIYPWRACAAERGCRIETVPRPGPRRTWTDEVLDRIDARTALVAVPHAHWTDGSLLDLRRVGEAAGTVDAALVVDGTQSIGALPFDAPAFGVDAVACASYKWLLGPYSLGFLWMGERFRSGKPIEHTWIGRRGSEDFRGLVDYTDALREDASRFDSAERSNFALMPMAIAGLEYVLNLGVDAIRAHCAALTAAIAERSAPLGARPPEGARADHIVGLRLPAQADGAAVFAGLAAAGVHVSRRGSALRVSPHVYNDASDGDALLGALERAL